MLVATQPVDSAEMAEGFLAAARLLVDFGEMAMGGDQKRIAGCCALQALQRMINLAALPIEQSKTEVNIGVTWKQHRGGL